jgi:hypothetical protein
VRFLKICFKEKTQMKFKLDITTSGGGERTIEQEATSVQDAITLVTTTYPKCKIKTIDLIPKSGCARIYSNGDQLEVPVGVIYIPFK